MNKKGKHILALIPVGILIFLLLVVNIVVIVRGRVSLKQGGATDLQEINQEETEIQEESDTKVQTVQIEDFRIERESNVVGTPAETKEKTDTAKEYLCADSIVRVLNNADVDNLRAGVYEDLPEGKDIIQMVVNEIYARNGYQFENEAIQAYFSEKSWYQASEKDAGDMDAIYGKMSEIDKANIDFLKEVR